MFPGTMIFSIHTVFQFLIKIQQYFATGNPGSLHKNKKGQGSETLEKFIKRINVLEVSPEMGHGRTTRLKASLNNNQNLVSMIN